MTAPTTLARNAGLSDLVAVLQGQQPRKIDIVAPVSALRMDAGRLVVTGAEVEIGEDGVTQTDGVYDVTAIFDEGLSSKLSIPPGYLRTMRTRHIGLYDQNANGWLTHEDFAGKKYLVRALRNEDGNAVARAFLSDSYKIIDNLDVLMTVLDGLREAGVQVQIERCDLTDRRMYVRVVSEQIRAMAPTLLANYRNPWTGATGADNPVVFGGLEIRNSEVGQGAFQIAPHLTVQVCRNGMTMNVGALRAQHLGAKLDEGAIRWSNETQERNLALIRSQTVDAVKAFLDPEWVQTQVTAIERKSAKPVEDTVATIEHVVKRQRYTEAQQADILSMFIKGGDLTAGGVMQAVTASAQNQTDADLAAAMESDAMTVLDLAAAFQR